MRATWIAPTAAAATRVSRWPPPTSARISTGFAVQNSVARTGSSDVRSRSTPTPRKTSPFSTIHTRTVVATWLPPTQAANDCSRVATGPYTDGWSFHIMPTGSRYAASPHASGLVTYGLPPCAAMRPYTA